MTAVASQKISPVVIITGASAGVGRAAAQRFARDGAVIGLIGRDEAALEETRTEIGRLGGHGVVLKADVADAGAVMAAADRMVEAHGGIHIWVNNAMVTIYSTIDKLEPDEIRRVTEVTYLGTVHGTLAALKHMRKQGHGTIVQVGSALAFRGIPLQSAYCAAKHAIDGFTDSLRSELIRDGSRIRVTSVHLPAINTPQFSWARTHMGVHPRPVGTVYQPEVAARAIVKAAYKPRRDYWLGGPTIQAILGDMVAPGIMDKYLASSAHDGQSTGEPVAPDRPDNLFEPGGEHRTRGRFIREAQSSATLVQGFSPKLIAAFALAGSAVAIGFAAGFLARPQIRAQQLRSRRQRLFDHAGREARGQVRGLRDQVERLLARVR